MTGERGFLPSCERFCVCDVARRRPSNDHDVGEEDEEERERYYRYWAGLGWGM